MKKLNKEQLNKIYDILVKDAGAVESERDMFIHVHTKSDCDEYRFQGKFGFGGKFWSKYLDINYYSEDKTKELDKLRDSINEKIMLSVYGNAIGKKVTKKQINEKKKDYNPKPFKSGSKINTVSGLVRHPHLRIPAYTFEEDDSIVECRRCKIKKTD